MGKTTQVHYSKKTRGFTLVEIMVVVVIVSLLAALAIPMIRLVQRRTRTSMMDNDVRQLAQAAIQYSIEYSASTSATIPFTYDIATGAITGPLSDYVKTISTGYVFSSAAAWDVNNPCTVDLPKLGITHKYDESGRRTTAP